MSPFWIRRLTVLALTALLCAGCSGDDTPDAPETDNGNTRVVEHRFGETEITGTPQRVVSLGYADVDPLLALGVKPIAIRPAYGLRSVGPWARKELGAAKPKVLDHIDVAAIAAMHPDLITAISAPIDHRTYERLSKIAPTIVRPAGTIDDGVSWEVATTMIGSALDKPGAAKDAVKHTKLAINDTLRANPRIDGTNGEVVRPAGNGWQVDTPVAPAGQFLFELGVNPPPKLARRDDGKDATFSLAPDQTDELEADVVLATGDAKQQRAYDKRSAFDKLAVNQRDAVVHVASDKPVGQALDYGSVLSLPYALHRLAPKMSEALD